jgi:uncharacterized protein (TIGR02996 family)
MSDEDAFIRAILDTPGDSAPRLVYADWLEERGDARAEYLRLLCAITEREGMPGNGDGVRARLAELRASLDPAWIARVQPSSATDVWGYSVVCEMARGAFTTVYEAFCTHPNLRGRRVTLRVVQHPRDAHRFLNAARIDASLQHPRIPPLFEVAEHQGRPYAVRQFVEGSDLRSDIDRAPQSPMEVARVATEIAEVLDYAHGVGVVHGYVHPRHVLLGHERSAWLIGFGEWPPDDRAIFGNLAHLAPEQLDDGGDITPRTDVYLLAESVLWALCGRHPFRSFRAIDELRVAKRAAQAWRVRPEWRGTIPAGVESVLRRALSPAPADRYLAAGEFAAALLAAVQGGAAGHRPWWRFW